MRSFIYFLFTFVPFLTLAAQEKAVNTNDHMRNARYGEIIVISGGPFSFTGHIYNTIGLNDCPEAAWKALNATALKKTFHARAVTLNGPRYFLMDEATASHSTKIHSFGTLQTRHIANLNIPLATVVRGGAQPYTENVVLRDTSYIFKKGRTIYELSSPSGATYVMQSYPKQRDPNFTEADLAKIGKSLTLPTGWHFQARTLDQDFVMKVTGTAYVLRDNLENAYQRE